MLIVRLSTLLILVMLTACSSTPKEDKATLLSTKPAGNNQFKRFGNNGKNSIEPDVLFMLLAAEIAGQRGQYDVALEGYLEAAKRVNDPRFAERAAMIAMYTKDANKTDEAIAVWLRQDPANIAPRKIAALSALKDKDKPAAIEHLGALLKYDPAGFDKTIMELATVLGKENRFQLIYDIVEQLSKQYPERANIYFVQALLAAQLKQDRLAEQKVADALRLQPEWDKAIILQAQLAAYSGDMARAKGFLKNAITKFPDNTKLKKLLAQVLIKSENYEEAGEVYRVLIDQDANDYDSLYAYGMVHLQQERDDKAEEIFNKLLSQPEWRNQASYYLGKIEEQRGNKAKALEWFAQVSEPPLELDANLSAIALLSRDKQFIAASNKLDAVSKKYPRQKQRLLLMQADLFSQQKQYQQAFNLLSKAIKELGEQKELLYSRALVADHLGKLSVMEADLQRILHKDPNNAEALNALGYSLAEKSTRYREAEQYLQRALTLQPEEAVIIDSYGWLLYKMGDTHKALSYLQKAYAKRQETEIAAHLVEVLWVSGRKTEARQLWWSAINKSPKDEYLLAVKLKFFPGE